MTPLNALLATAAIPEIHQRTPIDGEAPLDRLRRRIAGRTAQVGIIGMGYVGLPLAVEFAREFAVVGFDSDPQKVERLARGEPYILDVPATRLLEPVRDGRFAATTNYSSLSECDAIVICVPTPLEKTKDPDLSYVESAAHAVVRYLRPGQIVILESTSYPGTTDEVLLPLLSQSGFMLDRDFYLAFSPERVDPGNRQFQLTEIPKVVGGCSEASTDAACLLYASIMKSVHRVSSARTAEAAKLLENTFRLVNIGLANEMALLCNQLGIDAHEVIDAASTKPFGYMPFYPGPGVGGHCIPLDPLYLSWKAKQQGFISQFIRLADEVNSAMPGYVVRRAAQALNERGRALNGSRILLIGVAYKANVNDTRHAPAIAIVDRLRADAATVVYHDPLVARLDIDLSEWPEWRPQSDSITPNRRRLLAAVGSEAFGRRRCDPLTSVALTSDELARADCTIIVTGHDIIDYDIIVAHSDIIVDSCNALTPDQRAAAKGIVVRL